LKTLCTFLLTFTLAMSFAQTSVDIIMKVDKNHYFYQDSMYTLQGLDFILHNTPVVYEKFNIGRKGLKHGKIYGYISLGSIAVGGGALLIEKARGFICDAFCSADLIALVSWGLVTPITGSIALIKHFGGKSKLNGSIEDFNANKKFDAMGRLIESPQLHLASQGIGIKVVF